jgi:hypothetical protein
MYAILCAMREDELAELRALDDARFTARVFGGEVPALIDDHERTLHLETWWAAVDFVLTGATLDEPARPPLDLLRFGATAAGEPVGPDLGHGRARLFSPEHVRALAAALDALEVEDIEARVASPRLADAFPFADVAGDDDEALLAAARVAIGAAEADGREGALSVEALVAQLKPPRGPRPTASERADVREAVDELRAFVRKLVRDGAGVLVSIA